MNKTVTVNISGFVFYIEEDAYTVLSTYLNRIKSIFQSDEGGDEIFEDVESRIAELFQEKLDKKEVITMSDVEEVIQVMGKPEDYIEEGTFEKSYSDNTSYSSKSERRKIYRDPDDKILGGVCSGLGHYLDIDALFIRIALVLFFIFGGFGLLLYIILWILIPKAETTAEKLRMHGEKINVENIKKKVNDFSTSTSLSKADSGIRHFADRSIGFIGTLFGGLGRVMSTVLAVIFGFMAFGLIIGVIAALIAPESTLNISDSSLTFGEIKSIFFHGQANFWFCFLGILLLSIVPIVGLFYAAVRLISGSKYRTRGLGTALIVLFIAGVIITFTGALKTAKAYKNDGDVQEFIALESDSFEQLNVTLLDDNIFHSGLEEWNTNFWELINTQDDRLYNGTSVFLDIKESKSEKYKVKVIKESQGGKSLDAIRYAEDISYNIETEGNNLYLAPYFHTPKADGFRAQRIIVQVFVPEGKNIYLDENTSRIHTWHGNPGNTYKYLDGERHNLKYLPEPEDIEEENADELESDSLKIYNL